MTDLIDRLGPTVTLIGISLVQSGFEGWGGGSGTCYTRPDTGKPYFLLKFINISPQLLLCR